MIATSYLHNSDETLIGWLHLLYHLKHPELYIPSRDRRLGCRFCPKAT
jgi:hypothetical protein